MFQGLSINPLSDPRVSQFSLVLWFLGSFLVDSISSLRSSRAIAYSSFLAVVAIVCYLPSLIKYNVLGLLMVCFDPV